jgi:quercetin dioxygenase-like cupin family protein
MSNETITETITIGQMLGYNATPIPGTGVVLNKYSPTAQLLLAQQTVLISNPVTQEYGAKVKVRNDKGELVFKGLGIIPPGCIGPPEHIHPTYDESFTVLEGSFDFLMNKKSRTIYEGETLIVKRGTPHTFKPADMTRINSMLVEANPPGKLQEVIRTIWGLAHDGKTNDKGQPKEFWQGIAIGYELQDDTLFVSPPPFVQRLMFTMFGKTALRKGYKGIYDKYVADSFWLERVQQMPQE